MEEGGRKGGMSETIADFQHEAGRRLGIDSDAVGQGVVRHGVSC